MHQPRLLLLDEPLGALDALTRIEMQCLIERLWQQHNFTVLLVTHDVAEAVTLGDRVVLIEQGRHHAGSGNRLCRAGASAARPGLRTGRRGAWAKCWATKLCPN